MDEVGQQKVEIFAPFGAALDLTKLILFQPFDLTKWFVIGFAAFLSHLAGGGGTNFNFNWNGGKPNWSFRTTTHDAVQHVSGMPPWVLPLVAVLAVVVIALVIVFLWLGSRGKFIFTDCVVRNRGAIEEPWREFRREGNSYFLFSLLIAALALFVFTLATLPLWLPLVTGGEFPEGIKLVLVICFVALVSLVVFVPLNLISSFMVPIMYRQRCGAAAGFSAALHLISLRPGVVVLYFLFVFVLWVAFAMISCVLTCVTCCITAVPYVGTVILLPAYVFFTSYLLLFLRQFGPDYDAWAAIRAAAEPAPELEPPPTEPPSTEPPPLQT